MLGHVRLLVRDSKGQIMVVIDFGGFFGFGSRLIAIPADAMVLVGQDVEVVAFTPDELRGFPTFTPSGAAPIANDAVIEMGLAKPSH